MCHQPKISLTQNTAKIKITDKINKAETAVLETLSQSPTSEFEQSMHQKPQSIKMRGLILIWSTILANFHLASSIIPPPVSPYPGTYTSYQIGPVCRPLSIRTPETVQEVLNIVEWARDTNTPIKAFGNRHSMTDIICTEGIAVDMSKIKGFQMNQDLTVTVAAGVTLRELGEFLHLNNRAIRLTPAYGGITIGGALGTGSHGSSLRHESALSEQTVSVKIIDGTGVIRVITSPEEIRAYRIHLGMLGIILEATLITVENFKIFAHNYETTDNILFNGLWEPMARASDYFFIYWFPLSNKVVVSNGTFVGANTPGDAWSNDHVPPTSLLFNTASYTALESAQGLDSFEGMYALEKYMQKTLTVKIPEFVPIYTENGFSVKNPAVGYSYKMNAAVCGDNCPWLHYPFNLTMIDNEVSVNIKHMAGFVRTIKDILIKLPAAFPLQGILMRFSKSSSTYMSTTNGQESVHFEWYSVKRRNPYDDPISRMATFQLMMQTLVFTYGGKSHWGKTGLHYHSRGILQNKVDPANLKAFLDIRKKADPNDIFMNNFGRRLLNLSDRMDIDPGTKHCAILDNCICSQHMDCAPGQFCGKVLGFPNFNLCLNINDQNPKYNINKLLKRYNILL